MINVLKEIHQSSEIKNYSARLKKTREQVVAEGHLREKLQGRAHYALLSGNSGRGHIAHTKNLRLVTT